MDVVEAETQNRQQTYKGTHTTRRHTFKSKEASEQTVSKFMCGK